MTDKLKTVLKMFADFEEHDLDKISDCFKPKSVKKNDILLHEGSVCKEFYFIPTGCIRTFFIDKNGHEKTSYVMFDNHIGKENPVLIQRLSNRVLASYLDIREETLSRLKSK